MRIVGKSAEVQSTETPFRSILPFGDGEWRDADKKILVDESVVPTKMKCSAAAEEVGWWKRHCRRAVPNTDPKCHDGARQKEGLDLVLPPPHIRSHEGLRTARFPMSTAVSRPDWPYKYYILYRRCCLARSLTTCSLHSGHSY